MALEAFLWTVTLCLWVVLGMIGWALGYTLIDWIGQMRRGRTTPPTPHTDNPTKVIVLHQDRGPA